MEKFWMAPGGLHIEPATTGDADPIARLHAAGFYRGWPREEFTAYLADPERTPAFVACDARRRVVGFAMLRLAADEAELMTIAVDPKRRNKGLGAALLAAALADLMMSRAKRLFLEVAADNAPAIALYRRHGFAEIGRRNGYYPRSDGQPATALVMARNLG
jgi:[ribosomal protein S18]-alanine N-acetyltransferase